MTSLSSKPPLDHFIFNDICWLYSQVSFILVDKDFPLIYSSWLYLRKCILVKHVCHPLMTHAINVFEYIDIHRVAGRE